MCMGKVGGVVEEVKIGKLLSFVMITYLALIWGLQG